MIACSTLVEHDSFWDPVSRMSSSEHSDEGSAFPLEKSRSFAEPALILNEAQGRAQDDKGWNCRASLICFRSYRTRTRGSSSRAAHRVDPP